MGMFDGPGGPGEPFIEGAIPYPRCGLNLHPSVDVCPACGQNPHAHFVPPAAAAAPGFVAGPQAALTAQDQSQVPAEPSEEASPQAPGATQPQGTVGVIQHDVVINGVVAFRQGERVRVEGESPDPDRPDCKYIVMSKTMNKRYRLSDIDVFL
ncbi:MAG TPA: hypothetical protein VIK02_04360 [Candidatus Anoxymicrobiaceae bacterium]